MLIKWLRGNIDADTVFQNIPFYNLLRENQMELKTGDSVTDALLENAIVIPCWSWKISWILWL